MLAESIVRIGNPIKKSGMPNSERIRLLTDVSSENCKNFFRNVLVVELGQKEEAFHHITLGGLITEEKKISFHVDRSKNVAFPIQYPNGGNPNHAQGIYPIPCYLMYEKHMNLMDKPDEMMSDVLLPRINKTVQYRDWGIEGKEKLAMRVAQLVSKHSDSFLTGEKQLGILMICDLGLDVFEMKDTRNPSPQFQWITESRLQADGQLHLNTDIALEGIAQAKFEEASELGEQEQAVSTFSNQKEDRVVSIYNKSWLWLSPTWEMPRSIYWGKDEWTNGIKVDQDHYESFLYGTQFLKQIQVPVSSSILKEMFAPIESVEAKRHKKATSYDQIFGVPMVLPLLDGDSTQIFKKYWTMLKKDHDQKKPSDLHLEILAGMKESIVPDSPDDHRLTILYFSGDLSRGAMHVRAVIEDVIPSVAREVQVILSQLRNKEVKHIQDQFELDREKRVYRLETLPALLGNAFGSGYIWDSLQRTLHKQPLQIHRSQVTTMKKLNELANREDYWAMKHELVFYYGFLYFIKNYDTKILQQERGVRDLSDWKSFIDSYHAGNIVEEDVQSSESLGFAAGLLLKQFSNSYFKKTGKDFVKHRVMKFGSKLTPEMIWKNGVLRCEELAEQWDLGLKENFREVLAQVLLGFLKMNEEKTLVSEKEKFMTAFWSGYLIYKKKEEA